MNIQVPLRGFGFYPSPHDDVLDRLRASRDVTIKDVDVSAIRTKMELLVAVARALDFPAAYLGHINYDSFEEAVRDLSWLHFSNIVIILTGCSRRWSDNYPVMAEILEILVDAHRFWDEQGKGFFVAFVE